MPQFASIIPYSLRKMENGDLGVVEFAELPFEPKRIYWLTGVDDYKSRGHHAHKKLRQYFVVVKGSVDVFLTDGFEEFSTTLHADGNAILLASGLWREIRNFSDDAVLLVVCDQPYSEDDYIRDFNQFLDWKKS